LVTWGFGKTKKISVLYPVGFVWRAKMSHLVNGFCVKDITALKQVVEKQCPQLELVEGTKYRTWITDHGRLAGDYPIPGVYQTILAENLKAKGLDLVKIAAELGVTLPANTRDLENNPWDLVTQKKLLNNSSVRNEYENIVKNRMSKDSQYVIRYKASENKPQAYEIGLVPHPFQKGEYIMMTDFYLQGNGLLWAKGVGQHTSKGGVDAWANELKQSYAARATERAIERQQSMQNPAYGQVSKQKLPDGRIVYQVRGR
jgi:hypothetical protein